jgi:hypothetical protein
MTLQVLPSRFRVCQRFLAIDPDGNVIAHRPLGVTGFEVL